MSDVDDLLAREARRTQPAAESTTPLRVLFYDIETAPSLAHIWRAKTEYVGTHAIQHEIFFLTWAAKWWGQKKVHSDRLTGPEALAQDDARVVSSLADLIREADVIVAHNGDRFDMPTLNSRLLLLGLEPLPPVRSIDTLKLARKSFKLMSNKLDWLASELGLGHKSPMGWSDWEKCYHGDEKSLKKMDFYCRKDVRLLEQVYEHIEPYVKGVPRLVDGTPGVECCPACGSDDLSRDGFHRTNSSTFPRFRCGNCARYSRSRRADTSRRVDLAPL